VGLVADSTGAFAVLLLARGRICQLESVAAVRRCVGIAVTLRAFWRTQLRLTRRRRKENQTRRRMCPDWSQ